MRRFLRWVRATFVSGLLALGPLALSLYLLWLLYRLAYGLLGPETAFSALMRRLLGRYVPGVEIAASVILILLVGVVARHWVGRGSWPGWSGSCGPSPGCGTCTGARQLAHVVLGRDQPFAAGRRIVLVEFPQPNSFVIGILTNEDVAGRSAHFTSDTVAVYIPTAPNPFRGGSCSSPEQGAPRGPHRGGGPQPRPLGGLLFRPGAEFRGDGSA